MSKVFTYQLFSDIHMEFSKSVPNIPVLSPYLFLAGDIGKINTINFNKFIDYCNNNWKKTFYICGNHEYYSSKKTHLELNQAYKNFFNAYPNVIMLDDSYYDIIENDYKLRIYGSTLWSEVTQTNELNDFNRIKMRNSKYWRVPINKEYFNELHDNSLKNLINTVNESSIDLIIMTHFPPLRKTEKQKQFTSHSMHESQPAYMANYFANNLLDEKLANFDTNEIDFYSKIKLWLSGHTHYSYNFTFNRTQFLSNQIGYIGEQNLSQPNYSGVFELV